MTTVVLNGTELTRAENLTGWTATKIAGTGGGPSPALADGPIEGSGAVTCVVSRQHVSLTYDLGAGNELDFTPGTGANAGQALFIWGQFLAAAGLTNRQGNINLNGSPRSGGLNVIVSTAGVGTDYLEFFHDGNDTYDGRPKQFIQDPALTASSTSGTTNIASIRHVGLSADVGASVLRFDNLIVDFMWVGYGLRVYGTSTAGDLAGDLLVDEATNKWGVFKPLNGSETAVELAGQVQLGDNVGTNAATLSNVSQGIYLAEPTYSNGVTPVDTILPTVPKDFFKVEVVGNATGATDVTVGAKVGTGDDANGRNGVTLVGNPTYDLSISFDDGNVNALKVYGSTFENITGPITWGTNTAHECIGNTFVGSSQVDPVGGIEIRNCQFVATADPGATKYAALLWNAAIDIKNCNFIDNTDPDADIAHGIQFPAAGTFNLDNLQFLGNEVGVWFSATTGNLTLNKVNGTNLGGTDFTNDSTGTVTIVGTFVYTVTDLTAGSRVVWLTRPGEVELENQPEVGGQAQYAHDGTVQDVWIQITSLNELNRLVEDALGSVNQSLPATQSGDPFYLNP